MKTLRLEVDATIFSEAMLFASTDTSRPQLCGVCVKADGSVEATDGHTAYLHEQKADEFPDGYTDTVLRLYANVPRSAKRIEFLLTGADGFARFFNKNGKEIGRAAAAIASTKFPATKQILPTETSHKATTNTLHMNPTYMNRVAKVFKDGTTIEYHDDNSPVIFKCLYRGYAGPTIIVMPMREQ